MSEQKTFDYMVKLLLIGSPCVGKTSILRRFADDAYSDSYVPTVGVDFKVRNVDLGGKIVKLQLWDAGGVKKFRSITESHYRGIHGVIFVYDVTNQNSFLSLQDWLSECNSYASSNVRKLIVGNKMELDTERCVHKKEGEELAVSVGSKFMEVSAKSGENIETAFLSLAIHVSEFFTSTLVDDYHGPIKLVSRVNVKRRWEVASPKYIRSIYENFHRASISCSVRWNGKNFPTDSAAFIYQVALGAVGIVGHFWVDLGVTDTNQFTIGGLAPDGELRIRVRAAQCGSSVMDYKRQHCWGPWSESLILNLDWIQHAPFTLDGSCVEQQETHNQKHWLEASDWKPHWTSAYLCDICEKCSVVFSLNKWKHHCRQCGKCLCAACCPSQLREYVQMYGRKVRICLSCDSARNFQLTMRRARLSPPEPDFSLLGLAYLSTFSGLSVIHNEKARFWTQGATAIIYKGTYNGIPVAIKMYKMAFLSVQTDAEFIPASDTVTAPMNSSSTTPDQLQMEEHVYRVTNKCPYAVNMILCSSARSVTHPFIATELLDEHGTLLAVLENRSIELSWQWRLTALLQVAEFLVFLHEHNIVHLDLKAENCVVTSVEQSILSSKECVVKVFDFNSSTTFGLKTYAEIDKLGRTPSHTPPEFARSALLQERNSVFTLDGKFDIFSFGILLAEVATRGLVYADEQGVKTVQQLEEAMRRGVRPCLPLPSALKSNAGTSGGDEVGVLGDSEGGNVPARQQQALPRGYEDLACRCWSQVVTLRPTATQLVAALKEMLVDHSELLETPSKATPPPAGTGEQTQQHHHQQMQKQPSAIYRPTPIPTDHPSPLYIVVLKQKAFQKPLLGRYSVAETLQREIPGLFAFVAGTPDLKRYSCLGPSGEFQLKTVYKRHAKDPKKYVLPSQYAEHLLVEKEKEFIKIMHGLGAKEIRLRGREAKREEVKAKASFSGAVFADVSVKGAYTESRTRERDCSCQFDKPFRTRPMVDRKEHYLFYDDWAGIVEARLSNSPLLSQTATFSFSCENSMSAKLSAKIHEFGLSVGGSTMAGNHFSDSYEILFYTRADYNACNRVNLSLWNTTKVKRFLEYLDLHEYILLFAQKSIRGMDLLSENLYANLAALQVSDIHAERLVDAVQLQINGHTDFQCD